MHIYADDIHTVAHLNDVRYFSLVYIAYTNNAANAMKTLIISESVY